MYFETSIHTGLIAGSEHRLREDSILICAHPALMLLGIIEGRASEDQLKVDGRNFPVGYMAAQLAHNAILDLHPKIPPRAMFDHVEEYLREKGSEYASDARIFAVDMLLLRFDDQTGCIEFASVGRCCLAGAEADDSIELLAEPNDCRVNEAGWKGRVQKMSPTYNDLSGFPNHQFNRLALFSDGLNQSAVPYLDLEEIARITLLSGTRSVVAEMAERANEAGRSVPTLNDDASSIILELSDFDED